MHQVPFPWDWDLSCLIPVCTCLKSTTEGHGTYRGHFWSRWCRGSSVPCAMERRNSAPQRPEPAGASDVSAFFAVSRLQAKYKGFLGKRAYQKKRKAGTGSGMGDSLRAGLSTGAGALGGPKSMVLWAALGAVGVGGGGSCTPEHSQSDYRGSFSSVWILTP